MSIWLSARAYLWPDISVFSNGTRKVIISTKNDLGHERSNWADGFENITKSFTGKNPSITSFDKKNRLNIDNIFLVVNTIANSKIRKKPDINNSIKGREIVQGNVIFLLKQHPNPTKGDNESHKKLDNLKDNLKDDDFIDFLEPMFDKIYNLLQQ